MKRVSYFGMIIIFLIAQPLISLAITKNIQIYDTNENSQTFSDDLKQSSIDNSATEKTSEIMDSSFVDLYEDDSSNNSMKEISSQEEEVENNTATTDTSKELDQNELATFNLKKTIQDGTIERPYLVENESELLKALDTQIVPGNMANHIELMNDIVYKASSSGVDVKYDAVIEGNNHYMLSDQKNRTDHSFLGTYTRGLKMEIRNVNYGDTIHPNGIRNGIFWMYADDVELVVENINYDIKNGALPFRGNNYKNTTVILKGNNYFKQDAKSDGGELVNKINYIVFDEDSETIVRQDSYSAISNAVFWDAKDIYVNKNATVDIESSMNYLTWRYNPVNIHIDDNATFLFNLYKGKNYTGTNSYLNVAQMDVGENARVAFKTSKEPFSSFSSGIPKDIIINAESPDYILFENEDTKNAAISGISLNYNRMDNDVNSYSLEGLDTSGKQEHIKTVLPSLPIKIEKEKKKRNVAFDTLC